MDELNPAQKIRMALLKLESDIEAKINSFERQTGIEIMDVTIKHSDLCEAGVTVLLKPLR